MIGRLIFLGILVFYPKQLLEWIISVVIAFGAAYATVEVHGIAPIGIFLLWFMADYFLIQILFSVLNRRKQHA
jgi:hypothetical protein